MFNDDLDSESRATYDTASNRKEAVVGELISPTEIEIWDTETEEKLIMKVSVDEGKFLQEAYETSEFSKICYEVVDNEIKWVSYNV